MKTIDESLNSIFGMPTEHLYFKYSRPFINVHDLKTHVFVGKTGIGKTNFALAHFKKPVLVTAIQNIGRIHEDPNVCDGLVFDDINFSGYSQQDFIHLVDNMQECTVNIKYGTGYIPRFMPRIITCNNFDAIRPKTKDIEAHLAINRRLVFHNFSEPLYLQNTGPKILQNPYYAFANNNAIQEMSHGTNSTDEGAHDVPE